MTDGIDVREAGIAGDLLFKLSPDGRSIELRRHGWVHVIDIAETLRTGRPSVSRRYVGKNKVLTNINTCDRVSRN